MQRGVCAASHSNFCFQLLKHEIELHPRQAAELCFCLLWGNTFLKLSFPPENAAAWCPGPCQPPDVGTIRMRPRTTPGLQRCTPSAWLSTASVGFWLGVCKANETWGGNWNNFFQQSDFGWKQLPFFPFVIHERKHWGNPCVLFQPWSETLTRTNFAGAWWGTE